MAALLSAEQLEDFKAFVLAGAPARQAEYRPKKPNAQAIEPVQAQPAWGKVRTNFQSPVRPLNHLSPSLERRTNVDNRD